MSRWGEQLDLLIRSRTPILWIHQQEEERLIRLLGNACQRLGQRGSLGESRPAHTASRRVTLCHSERLLAIRLSAC